MEVREGKTNETGVWIAGSGRSGRYRATATLSDGRTLAETVTVEGIMPTVVVTVTE